MRKIAIILISIAVVLPLVPILIWSFAFRWYFPDLLPSEWGVKAWQYLLSPQAQTGQAFWNSSLVALAVSLISVIISLPAGRALGMHNFRGKSVVELLILAPAIVPTLAVAMGIHVWFIRYRLTDSYLGVILVHLIPVIPYTVLILAGAFAHYNPNYEAQARSLGATNSQSFLYVTLPILWPSIVVSGFYAFIISWSQYLLTLLIGGGEVITLPMLLFSFARSGNYAITAALSILFILPAMLFLFVASRYLNDRGTINMGAG